MFKADLSIDDLFKAQTYISQTLLGLAFILVFFFFFNGVIFW